jgi:tetratricopeptide (TPR) repeat protein
MGRLDKSVEVFQKAHSLNPKDRDILRELGIDYFLLGKLDPAIENLEAKQYLTSGGDQSDDLQKLYYLGRAYQEKGDLVHALPLFLKIQKEMPEFPDVCNNLGSVYGRMNQKGRSHFYFGKYFKLIGDKKSALLHYRTADPG